MAAALTRETHLTREEFLRELSHAVGGTPFKVDGNHVEIDHHGKIIRIVLTGHASGRDGARKRPTLQADFAFEHMTDDEIESFMSRWDKHALDTLD